MRVLILTSDYPPACWSGVGVAAELHAQALARHGIEVEVVTAPAAQGGAACGGAAAATAGGVTVHRLGGPCLPVDPRRFDLVHLHSLPLAELAWEICRRFDLPLVYTAHASIPDELAAAAAPRSVRRFWSAAQALLLARCWRVVFPSEAERRAAVCRSPELAVRSRVVPHGLPEPPPRRAAAPRRPGAAPAWRHGAPGAGSPARLLFAGRFARTKGTALLAEVLPRILARRPVRLLLAGGHGDACGEAAVRRLLAACPGACRLAGWLDRDRLEALFAAADLVLVPSLYEPFGLVPLEAMRMGAPVLAAAVGGLPEVVGEGSGGRLVASRDPAAWAAAALDILDDPAGARELGDRGPRHVAGRFSLAAMARRLVEDAYAA